MIVDISNGELLDKITILKIKLEKIKDIEKSKHVMKEHDTLVAKMMVLTESLDHDKDMQGEYLTLFDKLFNTNMRLWSIEDQIREKETIKEFDQDFIELARSIYYMNDTRARLKKRINELTNSELVEIKSYSEY